MRLHAPRPAAKAGATTLRAIADALNARVVPAARGAAAADGGESACEVLRNREGAEKIFPRTKAALPGGPNWRSPKQMGHPHAPEHRTGHDGHAAMRRQISAARVIAAVARARR